MRLVRLLAAHPRAAALVAASLIAFSGILYRFAEVSPSTGSVFRALYGLPLLLVAARWETQRGRALDRRAVAVALAAGAFFAVDLLAWHRAIEAVGVGLATVLGNLQVLVVLLVSWLLLGERPSLRTFAAIPVVLVGVALISGLLDAGAYGEDPPLGVVLGVLTALSYGGYLILIRRVTTRSTPAGPVAVSTLATLVVAVVAGMVLGDLAVPELRAQPWLILYGVTSQSLGYLLISLSLPRLPSVLTSIILLAQPVMSVVLGMVLLREAPSLAQLGGVALVVAGIALATVPLGRSRRATRSSDVVEART
jgi:drug/metabolite transporter (DMT)-like permease